jgi:hypothetical protein
MSGDRFLCSVGNRFGGGDSVTVTLTVIASPALPRITSHPENLSVVSGGNATFAITAEGSPSPTYRWERKQGGGPDWSALSNGGAFSGATEATLRITGVTPVMRGDQFRCLAVNSVGSVPSNPATLTVWEPAAIVLGEPRLYAGFTIRGTVGRRYRLEWSAESPVPNWTPIETITLTEPNQLWVDRSAPAALGSRLYRAVELAQ